MNNIFENAYFGKAYKTRDGRKALYHCQDDIDKLHYLITSPNEEVFAYSTGIDKYNKNLDIVSEWQEPIVIKCKWQKYYDYRIIMPNGEGHVRVSFFDNETIISDLYVVEKYRRKGYASILLDKVDELLNDKIAVIYPLEEWQKEWYKKRNYIIGKEESFFEEELNKLANNTLSNRLKFASAEHVAEMMRNDFIECFKIGYRKAKQE